MCIMVQLSVLGSWCVTASLVHHPQITDVHAENPAQTSMQSPDQSME